MTFRKIRKCRKQVIRIMEESDEDKRRVQLEKLAKSIGAGIEHTKIVGCDTRQEGNNTVTHIRQNPISESELIHNINDALRTESMINTYKWVMITAISAIGSVMVAAITVLIAWKSGR